MNRWRTPLASHHRVIRQPWHYALLSALLGIYVSGVYLTSPIGTPGPDFDQAWWMARQLLQGHDPYAADQTLRIFVTRVYYPLTAAVVAFPLALLPLDPARLLFAAGGAAVFGYAIGRERPHLWPTLLGMPFLISVRSGQWAPLIAAAMILPSLGWLAAVKPNMGVVMLAGVRTKRAALILLAGGMVLLLMSLIIDVRWPAKWLQALSESSHFRPLILRPGGLLMLLALLTWRDSDARMLLALAVVPVSGLFYDVLPACLVCQTRKQAAFVALISHVSWMADWIPASAKDLEEQLWTNGKLLLWFVMFPALLVVLRRGVPDLVARVRRLRASLARPGAP